MWSQMSEPEWQLKAAARDTNPTAGTYNCTVFSSSPCPFKMVCLLPEGLGLCCRDFQTSSDVLGFTPLLSVPESCLWNLRHPLGTGCLAGAALVPRTPRASNSWPGCFRLHPATGHHAGQSPASMSPSCSWKDEPFAPGKD